MKKIIILILLMSLLFCCLIADTEKVEKADLKLEKYLAVTKTGERIYGKNGILNNQGLVGFTLNGEESIIEKNNLKSLYIQKGSKAAIMGVLGGLIGMLICVSIQYNTTTGYENNSAPTEIMVGTTIIGGLIGIAVGNSSKKWERIKLN